MVKLITPFLFLICFSYADQSSPGSNAELGVVKDETKTFAIQLYKQLSTKEKGNLFVSPLSLQTALILAYTGSKEKTASELANLLLSSPRSLEDVYHNYNDLLKSINSSALHLANRIFVEASTSLKEQFQENANKFLFASAENVDFKGAPEKARIQINEWAEKNTDRKIKELVQPGNINALTRSVIVNAILFKAEWMDRFFKERTTKQTFHISRSDTATVEMMHQQETFWYKHDEELKAKILKLRYVEEFFMVIILPDDIEGLAELESKLDKMISSLEGYGEMPPPPMVKTAIPKFKIESNLNFKDTLEPLGVKTMFSEKEANFGGLTDEQIYVSGVIQKSFVDVNEEGTVAAAATAVPMAVPVSFTEPPEKNVNFTAEHPFFMMITTFKENIPIFMGRFVRP